MRSALLSLDPAKTGVLHGFISYVHSQESHDLITEGVEGSRKLVWMYNRSVRVLPLPVLAAMNGHTAFVQELHLRSCHSYLQQTVTCPPYNRAASLPPHVCILLPCSTSGSPSSERLACRV